MVKVTENTFFKDKISIIISSIASNIFLYVSVLMIVDSCAMISSKFCKIRNQTSLSN